MKCNFYKIWILWSWWKLLMNLYKIPLPPTLQDRVKCKSLSLNILERMLFPFDSTCWFGCWRSVFFLNSYNFWIFLFFLLFYFNCVFFFLSHFLSFLSSFSHKYSYFFFLFFVGPFLVRSAQQRFAKFIDYAYTARYSKLIPFTGINI